MVRALKRLSTPTRMVLTTLLETPADEFYCLDLAARTGVPAGSLYPILARLEDHGWLISWWEDVEPEAEGRPRRRYYRLTGAGIDLARHSLAAATPQGRLTPGAIS